MSEQDHARLLLALLRRRWDDAARLTRAREVEPEGFVRLCVECEVPTWIHARLEREQRWELVGDRVREGLGRVRDKIRNDNILLLARLEQALDLLLGAGVVPVALKGADVLQRFYSSFDERTMVDVDLLVRADQLRTALAALESAGWTAPAEPQRTHYVRSSHHLPLHSPGPVVVDFELHWNLAQETRFAVDVAGLFERAQPLEIGGRRVLRMADEDLVAHLLLHHFTHYFGRGLKNLVDLDAISAQPDFSWDAVVRRVEAWNCRVAAGVSLRHMRKMWPELIPRGVLDALPVAGWRRALTWPLRSAHPLELYRRHRSRRVQLVLAAAMLERPSSLPAWLLHRARRDRQPGANPLDAG